MGAGPGEFTVSVNGKPIKGTHKVRATGGDNNFVRDEIGFVKVQELDGNILRIGVKSPRAARATIMNLRSVRLQLEQSGKG